MFGSKVRSKLALGVVAPIAAMTLVAGTPAAFGAVAAAKPSPLPVVVSFTTTKATIANMGGSFALNAKLKYALSCKISVSPGIKGASKSFSCSSKDVTKHITLEANTTLVPIPYTFAIEVTNKTGSATSANVVVTEAAASAPLSLSFRATKTTISNSGGTFTLEAKVKYALTCKITVLPALQSFPKTVPCSSNSVADSVTLGANRSENPIAYTFAIVVKSKSGRATSPNVLVTEASAPPPISFTTPNGSPTTLDFANEGVFVADDPLIVTVHNNSPKTQLISSVTIGSTGDPSDFLLNRNNCTYVTAYATCSLAVQFQPTGAGHRTGIVNVVDASWGSGGASVSLNLSGTGVWAVATLINTNIQGNALAFPTQIGIGTQSLEQFVTLVNSGTVPLYVDGLTDTGGNAGDFIVSSGNCQTQVPQIISIGQNCTFGVTLEPSSSGVRASNVVVDDNTLGTQTQLQVQGTGAYSTDTLAIAANPAAPSPLTYDFSSAVENIPTLETLTITNTSDVTLVFDGVSNAGLDPNEFQVVPSAACATAGAQLAAGASCTARVEFDPVAVGARSAILKIADNSGDGGETINVSGTGLTG